MIEKVIVERFLSKVCLVAFIENSIESYSVGEIVEVTNGAVILKNLKGQRTAIDLTTITKIKERK